MAYVPNPFKLMDDFLLERVFNPLTWWVEYHYDRNAMDIRICVTYTALLILLLVSVFEKTHFLFFILLSALGYYWVYGTNILRRLWRSNNQTGKNSSRISGFPIRRINDVFVLMQLLTPSSNYFYNVLDVIGWIMISIVCGYLDATDATPPQHREFKAVPQT